MSGIPSIFGAPTLSGVPRPLLVLLVTGLLASPVLAEPPPTNQPEIWIEEVVVTPEAPGPETLCQLRVRLRNEGDRVASLLGFEVLLNGHPLPTYVKDLFVVAVAAGETTELRLFNFWTTETGREAPADGRWTLEVRLVEAQWATYGLEEGEPTWRSVGVVEGLPQGQVVTWGGSESAEAVDGGPVDG